MTSIKNCFHALPRISSVIAIIVMTVACVNHAYDFDRIDHDITLFGDDITIPLGQTGPLSIGSLLGEKMSDFIVPMDDGTCAIQYTSKAVNITLNELKKLDGAAPFQRFCDYPLNHDFSLFSKPQNPSFNSQGEADLSSSIPSRIELEGKSQSFDFSFSGLPPEIVSLNSVSLSKKSRIDVTLSIPDCLLTGGTVTPDLSLDVGSFLVSDAFPDGIIKIKPALNSGNGYKATTTIYFSKLALSSKNFNAADHSLSLNASMKFSGSCTISQPRTSRDKHAKAPDDVKLEATIVLHDFAISEVEGAFDYTYKSQVTFQLGDLSASITDKLNKDICFDFTDPTILLDVESNLTIPITAKLGLTARQNKVNYAQVNNIPITLPVATSGAFVSKRFRISGNPPKKQGEEAIARDLSGLLSKIPDDMIINAEVATKSDKTAVLRVGENYRVTISPQIIIPLSFGPNLKIAIRDTLDIPAQFGTLIEKNSFQVKGEIDNGFPLQFTFSFVMVDKDGVALTETVNQTLTASTTNEVELNLAKLPDADPTQITSAILSFEMDGIPDGRPIKTDDALLANLHLVIPGGFHVSL